MTVPVAGHGRGATAPRRASSGRPGGAARTRRGRRRRRALGRRAVAEDRPDRRAEDLGQVEVDRPDRPVEIDLLVQEQARRQEHLERAEARLVERQPALADERVAPQPLDVDVDRDAGHPGVAPDVVEVVDGEHARQERLEPADPASASPGRRGPASRRGTRPSAGRSTRRPRTRRAPGPRPGARRRPGSASPSSRSMISCERSSWVRRLPGARRGSGGAGKAARTWSSKKWANGPWPTSWRRPATRSVSTTRPSLGGGSPRRRRSAVRSDG